MTPKRSSHASDQLAGGARAERTCEAVVAVAGRRWVLPEEEDHGPEVAHPGGATRTDVVPEVARREPGAQLDAVPGPERGGRAGGAPHLVEQREHRIADVVVLEIEPLVERHQVVDRAAVVVHRALRTPGRSRRVHDVGEVELSRRVARHGLVAEDVGEGVRGDAGGHLYRFLRLADDDEVTDVGERDRAEALQPASVDDKDRGAGVLKDVLEKRTPVLDVDRHLDRPQPDARVPGGEVVVARRQHRRDPVSRPGADGQRSRPPSGRHARRDPRR